MRQGVITTAFILYRVFTLTPNILLKSREAEAANEFVYPGQREPGLFVSFPTQVKIN